MRAYTNWEQQIMARLVKAQSERAKPMKDLLEEFFFKEHYGRALILQNDRRQGVFFLSKEKYFNHSEKQEELQKLHSLIWLLNHLSREGYISLYVSTETPTTTIQCIQDNFEEEPKPNKDSLVLNGKGEYTKGPEGIRDASGEITYYGMMYVGPMYEQLFACTASTLWVSETLRDHVMSLQDGKPPAHVVVSSTPGAQPAAATPAPAAESGAESTPQPAAKESAPRTTKARPLTVKMGKKHRRQMELLLVLTIVLIGLVGFSLLMLHHRANGHDNRIDQMLQSHQQLKTALASVGLDVPGSSSTASATSTTYHGIDVSHWNGNLVEELKKANDIHFVICKATQGTNYVDPKFSENWQAIQKEGLIRGAYHFYITREDAALQARHFWNTVGQLSHKDMPPIVDIEAAGLSGETGADAAKIQRHLLTFLKELEKLSGRKPMIYTSGYFANEYLKNSALAEYPLWLAQYTDAAKPTVPDTWKDKGYKVWQKSPSYHLDSEKVDYDLFIGRLEDLVKS